MALLPARLAATPTGVRVNSTLDRLRRRNNELKKEAETSLTPVAATVATQTGAALAAVEATYLAPERVQTAHTVSALVLIAGGAVAGSPEAVAAGNGVLSVLTYELVRARLTTHRAEAPAP